MNHPDREARVSRAFVALADTLVEDYDVIALLDKLARYSAELLTVDATGILLADPRDRLRVGHKSISSRRREEFNEVPTYAPAN